MTKRALSPTGRLRSLMSVLLVLLSAACTLNAPVEDGVNTAISGVPEVRLAAPQPNASYREGVNVNIQALISNAGADIDRVEVAVDNTIIATLPNPNTAGGPTFSINQTWPAAGQGQHLISVTAFRADASSSTPATATINVIVDTTPTQQPTTTPRPTDTPPPQTQATDPEPAAQEGGGDSENGGGEPEQPAQAANTPDRPIATFNQGVNVRRGPGLNFNPPIGSFAAGQTADIVGVNPGGDWYKVRYYNADGWVFGQLLTVAGNTSDLAVDPGPPTPLPPTNTPIPPAVPTAVPVTAVPTSSANLVAGVIRLNPAQPQCSQTFNVQVDLANLGTTATTVTGTFTVQDLHNGQVQSTTQGPIPIIQAGQTVASADIPITVTTNFDTEHTIVVILNPSGGIPETGSGDNRSELKYTLQKGTC